MKATSIQKPAALGARQLGIVGLALATGIIHLVVLNSLMGKIDPLFTLNGLGYLSLAAAFAAGYFMPLARRYHELVRWALVGMAAATIVAWLFLGKMNDPLGIATKVIELALIGLLVLDRPKP